jgi:hypothetical protein
VPWAPGNFTILNQFNVASSTLMNLVLQEMNSSATGFPDLMDNLANSLSLSLRNLSYQPRPAPGRAFTHVIQAIVTWEWLILPAFEILASLVLLLLVMHESREKGLFPWANDILATLFHGFHTSFPGRQAQESRNDMEMESCQLLVEFVPHDDGGCLILVK